MGQERALATTFVMSAPPPGTDIEPLDAGQLSRLSEGSPVFNSGCVSMAYNGQTSRIIGMATAMTMISSGRPMRQ